MSSIYNHVKIQNEWLNKNARIFLVLASAYEVGKNTSKDINKALQEQITLL